MKIGIMGGTFDPIHNAHLIIPRCAKERFKLDKVVFMPGGNPPHKPGVTDKRLRLQMTRLAAGNEFDVCAYEVEKEEYSYTLKTLEYLTAKYPGNEFFFIIGEDSLRDITKWYRPREILRLCTLLVFPRESRETLARLIEKTKSELGGRIFAIDAPVFNVSSSEIRRRVRNGESIDAFVPPSVAEFIKANNLYAEVTALNNGEIISRLKETLGEKRFIHTMGVAETARKLAERFGADAEKAYLAGLLHDCAKSMKTHEQLKKCAELGVELDEYSKLCPPVIHAPLGAETAKREYGVSDEEILNAIRRHTVAGKNMTLLDKIIYTADMIEPSRDFEGVGLLRSLAETDVEKAFFESVKQSILFNIKENKIVHPASLESYNESAPKYKNKT